MAKIKIEDIQKNLINEGWKLISTEYKNLKEELIYECPESHTVYGSWEIFRNKKVCPLCKQNNFKTMETTSKVVPKNDAFRVIALDQATKVTGYAIYDDMDLIHYGIFKANDTNEIARDIQIKQWLLSLVDNWKPDGLAFEGIQYQQYTGVTTFETLARLQGILMEAIHMIKIPYIICPVSSWRKYCGVTGKRREDRKKSMQQNVKKWFDVSVSEDCADAIGIGKYAANEYKKWRD